MSEYNTNSENLADLVFKMKRFTLDQLKKNFKKICIGSGLLSGDQKIEGYLDDLREMGILRFENDHYEVRKLKRVIRYEYQ